MPTITYTKKLENLYVDFVFIERTIQHPKNMCAHMEALGRLIYIFENKYKNLQSLFVENFILRLQKELFSLEKRLFTHQN